MASFDNSYARLPPQFFVRQEPVRVSHPTLIRFNQSLAAELGLNFDGCGKDELADFFSGNRMLTGALPLAMAYAGHQFGQFVPQLGDGRALLLGEVRDIHGRRRDIQLKGSGRTPFSRGGDGRAALGPVLREYLVSEAMHALRVPATRAMAAVTTGDYVVREGRVPGAILTRIAASHVRVGTFQYFASRSDSNAVKMLADYVIERHYPDARADPSPYLALLRCVVSAQATLIARWMQIGFIHGVMNTDNMAVSGETIDFGPCAFMDAYAPATVFSSIDARGRYAYLNQPAAAQWNLARFAETLLPLIDADTERAIGLATEAVNGFAALFDERWLAGMRAKVGLQVAQAGDRQLIEELLDVMHAQNADFTLWFRGLSRLLAGGDPPPGFEAWCARWRSRCAQEIASVPERARAMDTVNPAFIPRNHRIAEVLTAAIESRDYAPFERLSEVLSAPYEEQPANAEWAAPPRPEERVLQTFCGT